jgi:hypothetical protein
MNTTMNIAQHLANANVAAYGPAYAQHRAAAEALALDALAELPAGRWTLADADYCLFNAALNGLPGVVIACAEAGGAAIGARDAAATVRRLYNA